MHIDDEQVEPAVVVEVKHLGADSAESGFSQSRLGDFGEGAVAVVVVELTAAEHVGDQHVEIAVFVVVEDGDVAAPAHAFQAGLLGNVGKCAVAVVVVENVVLDRRPGEIDEFADT